MLRVGDLDKSIQYYTEALGMRVLRRKDNESQKYTLAFLGYGDDDDNVAIELTCAADQRDAEPRLQNRRRPVELGAERPHQNCPGGSTELGNTGKKQDLGTLTSLATTGQRSWARLAPRSRVSMPELPHGLICSLHVFAHVEGNEPKPCNVS